MTDGIPGDGIKNSDDIEAICTGAASIADALGISVDEVLDALELQGNISSEENFILRISADICT